MNFPTSIPITKPVKNWPFLKEGQLCTVVRIERRGNNEFFVVAQKKDEILLENKYFTKVTHEQQITN